MAKRMKSMSTELMAMLERPRSGPIKPRNRYDDRGFSVVECDTDLQLRLYYAANKLLAKAGFFEPKVQEEQVLEPIMIGSHGLRPTWHGRA